MMLKRLIQFLVLFLLTIPLVFGFAANAQHDKDPLKATVHRGAYITKQEATTFINKVADLSNARNHTQLQEMFATNALISIRVDDKTLNFKPHEYFAMMGKGRGEAFTSNSSLKVMNLEVKEHRALAQFKVTETINSSSFGTIEADSVQAAIIEKDQNGKMKITSWMVKANYNQSFF